LNFRYALAYKLNPKAALISNLVKCFYYYPKDSIKLKEDKGSALFNIV
jgi:hypothetical protein